MSDFRSDNTCPPSGAVIKGLEPILSQGGSAYGEDGITERARLKLGEIFERDLTFFPIFTGTAANALAISQLSPRFGQVICHRNSHIYLDECGAVEFHSEARLLPVAGLHGKLVPEKLPPLTDNGDVHRIKSSVLSISQTTETGLVYQPDELLALTRPARAAGLKVHMDGTRFANAVAYSSASPAELSWKSGIDVLCLGATKGGAIGAEAVIFFDHGDALEFRRLMKRSGHLASRLWMLSAQILAWLDNDFWVTAAERTNQLAHRLDAMLRTRGIAPIYPVEGNMVYVQMTSEQSDALTARGFSHYHIEQTDGRLASRFVMSHSTTGQEVEALASAVSDCLSVGATSPTVARHEA